MTDTISCELPSKKYSRMISISDNLHQLAVAVAGGLIPLTFLSRGLEPPLPRSYAAPEILVILIISLLGCLSKPFVEKLASLCHFFLGGGGEGVQVLDVKA